MVAYAITAIVSPIVARRAAVAVLRGRPLPPAQAATVRRLALDGRTTLRLPIALGINAISVASATEAQVYLAELGVEVDAASLLRTWRLAYAVAARSPCPEEGTPISEHVRLKHGPTEDTTGRWGPVLHLLGVREEEIITASRRTTETYE